MALAADRETPLTRSNTKALTIGRCSASSLTRACPRARRGSHARSAHVRSACALAWSRSLDSRALSSRARLARARAIGVRCGARCSAALRSARDGAVLGGAACGGAARLCDPRRRDPRRHGPRNGDAEPTRPVTTIMRQGRPRRRYPSSSPWISQSVVACGLQASTGERAVVRRGVAGQLGSGRLPAVVCSAAAVSECS